MEQHLIGSRILRELGAVGYGGDKTALYTYLQTLRASIPSRRVTERFETVPGQQGQFDWSPSTVVLGGRPTKLVAFGLTLGFSRRKFYWLSQDETQASVFEALEASFHHFGGVPKELLVDSWQSAGRITTAQAALSRRTSVLPQVQRVAGNGG